MKISCEGVGTSSGSMPMRVVSWGAAVGLLSAALPAALFWLPPLTVYATSIAVIASIYVGFAVADGRRHVLVGEIAVAVGFLVLAAVALDEGPAALWLVVVGFVLHGLKDLWQHRTGFVGNTRWWPPFCVAVDWTAAVVIAGAGVLA